MEYLVEILFTRVEGNLTSSVRGFLLDALLF